MSPTIHPTALVDAAANLGAGVQVGAYAIIESGCVVGSGCEIRAHAILCSGTTLGDDNQVGYGAIIGAEPQDSSFKNRSSRVIVGARNRIREYVTIHRSATENGATELGDDNFLMAGAHLGHDAKVGDHVVMANNTLLGGHAQVGDGAFLGGATLVHQHGRVGRLAITRGGSALSQDLPPFFMAVSVNTVAGINRVGLRRAGLSAETQRAIQDAYRTIYRSGLNMTQAAAALHERYAGQPEIRQLLDFIAGSRRGICRDRQSGSDEE